jgi:ubiquinol-cytochrome c reductase cytochrome b subunit
MYTLPLIPVIKKWNKINSSIFPPTNCVAIIPFDGKLDSTLGICKITKFIRDITYINTNSLDIFIGLLLGDAYFKLGKNNINTRIGFKQSIINFPFFWLVFTELSHYCASIPRFEYAKIKGKKYGQLILETRTYPVLNIIYKLFIDNDIKVIKYDMFHYLSPIALAYWIMSDGTSSQYGLTICTDNFTIKDNILLMNILKIRYDLNCSLHNYAGRPRIYIKADSMNKLRTIVEPYIIPFSSYKLKKGKRPIL